MKKRNEKKEKRRENGKRKRKKTLKDTLNLDIDKVYNRRKKNIKKLEHSKG